MDEFQSLNLVLSRLRELGFADIKTDVRTYIGSRQTRADIIIDSPNGLPLVVGEVKTKLPKKLDRFHPAVTQAFSNANAFGCQYFFVADVENISWYEIKWEGESTQAIEILPSELISNMGKQQKETTSIRPSDWASIVRKFNSILDDFRYDRHRLTRINVFLLFLLIKKLTAESNNSSFQQFRTFYGESSPNSVEKLSEFVKSVGGTNFPNSFREYSKLSEGIIQRIVSLFEPYDLTALNLPKLYQETLVPAFVASEELQFATRPEVVKFVLATNDFFKAKNIIDPASGIGSFLISALEKHENNHVRYLTGIDKTALAVETVSMAMMLCDAENFNLVKGDFLSDWSADSNYIKFDFVFCDPPFGIKGSHTSEFMRSFWGLESRASISSEILFLIKIVEMLDDDGVAMILLPTSVLSNPHLMWFRKRLSAEVDIIASISWANAYGRLNIPAHLLVIQKKSLPSKPALFMSLTDNPDNTRSFDAQVDLAIEIYNHFRATGKIRKDLANLLPAVTASQLTTDLRFDYGAYNAGYRSLLDKLLNASFEVVKLSEIADIQLSRFPHKTNTQDESINIPMIRASNITENGISSELTSIAAADIPQDAYVQPGDILLANLGSSYPIAIISNNFPKAVCSRSLLRIRLKKNSVVDPRFLHLILSHKVSKTQLEYLSTGATIRRVTPNLLGDLLVPLLPRSDQENLIRKLEHLENYRQLALSTENELKEMVSQALGWEAQDETQP